MLIVFDSVMMLEPPALSVRTVTQDATVNFIIGIGIALAK